MKKRLLLKDISDFVMKKNTIRNLTQLVIVVVITISLAGEKGSTYIPYRKRSVLDIQHFNVSAH